MKIINNLMVGGGTFIKAGRLEGDVISGNHSSAETFIEADEVIGGRISDNVHDYQPQPTSPTVDKARPLSFRRRMLEGVAINALTMLLSGSAG